MPEVKENTLDDVKRYLHISYDDDDEDIQDFIDTSKAYIESCVGTGYSQDDAGLRLFNLLQKKFVEDMYNNRGTEISTLTKRDKIVSTIMDKLSNMG